MKWYHALAIVAAGFHCQMNAQFNLGGFTFGIGSDDGRSRVGWQSDLTTTNQQLNFNFDSRSYFFGVFFTDSDNLQLDLQYIRSQTNMQKPSLTLAGEINSNSLLSALKIMQPIRGNPRFGILMGGAAGLRHTNTQNLHPLLVEYVTPSTLHAQWLGLQASLNFGFYLKSLKSGLGLRAAYDLNRIYSHTVHTKFNNPFETIRAEGRMVNAFHSLSLTLQWEIRKKKEEKTPSR
jgi:hypothetical protein